MALKILSFLLPLLVFTSCELLHVIEFFRHGARTPMVDSDIIKTGAKYKSRELTEKGMVEEFALGREFRDRYLPLLSIHNSTKFHEQDLFPSEIFVRSTSRERTINTAKSKLMGIYSQDSVCEQRPDIMRANYEAVHNYAEVNVPIYTENYHEEDEFLGNGNCYLLQIDWLQRLNNKSFWNTLNHRYDNPRYHDLYKTLEEYFSISLKENSFVAGYLLSDYLISMKHETGESPILDEDLLNSFTEAFMDNILSETSLKVFVSRLLSPLIPFLQGQECLLPRSKAILISTHDFHLHHILKTVSSPQPIPFSSRITFELHSDPARVSLLKDGKPTDLNACGSPTCSLEEFIAYLEDKLLSPEEIKKYCKLRDGEEPISKNLDIPGVFLEYLESIKE
ncbi:unnamed protein product [Moneuplotes crassus]|uniref:Acid phosphatase n=1 Tax=Euplotes crassus TaxID=5936 RepID=A0AAD1U7H4_EUPCR|nr:unnamed protein product [Moneuplotes crassus]